MTITKIWRVQSPYHRDGIVMAEGSVIAEPLAVLRLTVATDSTETNFEMRSPAITGVLDRVVHLPVLEATDPSDFINPQAGGAFTLAIYQQFQHYPLIPGYEGAAMAVPAPDTADILDGNGTFSAPFVGATHLVSNTEIVGAGTGPIIQRTLVEDFLILDFGDWSDGSTAERRADFYFYFKQTPDYPTA